MSGTLTQRRPDVFLAVREIFFSYAGLMSKKQPEAPPEKQPKYVMPPNQSDLFAGYGGGLMRLRDVNDKGDNSPLVFLVDGPPGAMWEWTDSRWFERCCFNDPGVKQALEQVKQQRYTKTSIATLLKPAIQKFFEEQFLVDIVNRFDRALPSLVEYAAAKQAYYDLHPDENPHAG